MAIFVEVLKLIVSILIPGGVCLLFYIAEKKNKFFRNLNKYIKGILIGGVFAITTMFPCYFGMKYSVVFYFECEVKGAFGPMFASPLIASIIFGWVAGLTVGITAGIWRFFAISIYSKDFLRIGDSITIFLAVIIGLIISKFVFKKKDNPTPKWTDGLVLGLIVVSAYLLITFPILTAKYDDINAAHEIIYYTDWIVYLSNIFALCFAFLWLNIYNKQNVRLLKKQTNLTWHVQNRLSILFALALIVTFTATYITSYSKAFSDTNSDLILNSEDVVNELIDVSKTFQFPNIDIINSITLNRRIRTDGFIVIANAKDQKFTKSKNDEPSTFQSYKDQLISLPNDHIFYLGQKLYLNNDPNMTIDKVINKTMNFKDKSGETHEMKTSGLFDCYFHNYYKNRDIKFFGHAYKTHPIAGIDNQNEYYVCSFLTADEAADAVLISMRISTYYELLTYSIIYILVYKFIRRRFVDNIDTINSSLSRISSGKLNTKVNVKDYDEFISLSDDINKTVDTLKGYIADANKRIDDELRYAKAIQMNSIPLVFPYNERFDLFASMITAKQVGGDFYDFFFINEKHLFFMVADVSGKGIPAAMFMMRAKTLINTLAQTKELTLDQIVNNVNDELNIDNNSGMFVTAWIGILDISNGTLQFVNAGHTRPLIKDKNGNVNLLSMKSNTVLGVIPNFNYVLETITLKPCDQIVLYTDGVNEATNKKKQLYSEERIIKLFKNNKFSDSRDSIDALNKELVKFQKGVEQADDITILSLIYNPKKIK